LRYRVSADLPICQFAGLPVCRFRKRRPFNVSFQKQKNNMHSLSKSSSGTWKAKAPAIDVCYSSSEDDDKWEVQEEPLLNVFAFGWTEGDFVFFTLYHFPL
jgi:hypothetical protein